MTSKELNNKIMDICDDPNLYEYECFGGKCIPYIGWFWRTVDFDDDKCHMGDAGGYIGFMQNNKWDYPEFLVTGEKWDNLKKLLIEAVNNPCKQTLSILNNFIQELP